MTAADNPLARFRDHLPMARKMSAIPDGHNQESRSHCSGFLLAIVERAVVLS